VSSAVLIITLKKEGKKREKDAVIATRGIWYLVTQPSRNPAKHGLTLLCRQDVVLSL